MPWHIEKQGNKHCVVKDADGKSAGCHDTEGEAKRQLAALYVNEKEKAAAWERDMAAVLADQ